MPWTTPKHTKNEVAKAGDILVHPPPIPESGVWTPKHYDSWQLYEDALNVISNWRSAHGYPLWVFQRTLRNKATMVDIGALVSQRLKRLSAIRLKLRLHPNMALSQMQDIGGCRAVVRSVSAVYKLVKEYENSSLRHTLRRKTDYISTPRDSGYRGIHLMYRYRGRHTGPYDTLQIEMQIRSEYQHLWATAVETVGSFLSQALKSSQGQQAWLRFFALMGSAIAIREETPLVPGTPSDQSELISELNKAASDLQVETRLRAYGAALRIAGGKEAAGARFFLLELDASQQQLSIRTFKSAEVEKANEEYIKIEKAIAGQPDKEAVLVSVTSLAALRSAYPSYFLDTQKFLTLLKKALAQKYAGLTIDLDSAQKADEHGTKAQ